MSSGVSHLHLQITILCCSHQRLAHMCGLVAWWLQISEWDSIDKDIHIILHHPRHQFLPESMHSTANLCTWVKNCKSRCVPSPGVSRTQWFFKLFHLTAHQEDAKIIKAPHHFLDNWQATSHWQAAAHIPPMTLSICDSVPPNSHGTPADHSHTHVPQHSSSKSLA